MFLTWSTHTSFSPCKADLFDRRHFCASYFIWQLTVPDSGKCYGKAFLHYYYMRQIYIRKKPAFLVNAFLSHLPLGPIPLLADSWMLPVRSHYCSRVHSNVARWTLRSPLVTICTARFNNQQFYVLPTQCICVFCVDLRTNSDYFPLQD